MREYINDKKLNSLERRDLLDKLFKKINNQESVILNRSSFGYSDVYTTMINYKCCQWTDERGHRHEWVLSGSDWDSIQFVEKNETTNDGTILLSSIKKYITVNENN